MIPRKTLEGTIIGIHKVRFIAVNFEKVFTITVFFEQRKVLHM